MGEESVYNRFKFAAEMERVFASPEFSRSPVMRRLLRFLIDQTVAGKGGQLKAYSVAVDGLGRDPDFDAQSDSYPRVQVGRLRRMLDTYYNRNGLTNDERLVIPSGAYRVFLHPAYRPQERPSRPVHASDAIVHGYEVLSELPGSPGFSPALPGAGKFRWIPLGFVISGLMLALLVCVAAYMLLTNDEPVTLMPVAKTVPAPKMLLLPVEKSLSSPAPLPTSIDQILGDALHRSWVVDVMSDDNGQDSRRVENGNAVVPDDYAYRLQSVLAGPTGEDLYLTLWDNRKGDRLWTEHIDLSGQESSIATRLYLPIANLIGNFGAIATHQRQFYAGYTGGGYPCLLKNAESQIRFTKDNLNTAHTCLTQMLRVDPNSPTALAAAVYMNYRMALINPDQRSKYMALAHAYAKQAILLDPYSPEAQMASALMAGIDGRCTLGKTQALRALALNPYEALYHTYLGFILFQCGDPAYEKHLITARKMYPELPAFFSLPVIVAMGERGETDAALHLALSLPVSSSENLPYYAITMAIAYANHGDLVRARNYWQQTVLARTNRKKTPRAILNKLIVSPHLIQASGQAMIRAGLIDRLD
ncbi:tetratricopeptide repeat protein [Rhizorhapis sp. SPR117]|uniref:tetratricopeptide repeat protein n=1 Tax=Rhizorhapis sp. SPR117 TaxID=2912611 RepID=UPI001F404B49|nr:hypothetical protein [Rhizorhapis sp. SPR117]